MDLDKALQTQITNVQTRTGKTLDQLFAVLDQSGLEKFGQMRDHLKTDLGMGHGDANLVVTLYNQSKQSTVAGAVAAGDDPLDDIYAGPKAHLRPIHEALMMAIVRFGDFEIAPKKAYVSLRRKKQFATIGPATKTRVEVGLNMKGLEATDRLTALPAGGMCQYKVNVTDAKEVDKELIGWIKAAFDSAG